MVHTSPVDQSEISFSKSDAMDLVKALQSSKLALVELQKKSSNEILENLKKAIQFCSSKFDDWSAQEYLDQGIPKDFLKEEIYNQWKSRLSTWAPVKDESIISNEYQHATGVVGISVPWCLAFHSVMDRLVPALIAKNSVLIHLSEWSPRTALLIADFINAAELPPGAVQILLGERRVLTPLLAGHPGISALSWAGSEKHRASVVNTAAKVSKKIQVFTGSKNSLILLPGRTQNLQQILKSCWVGMGQMVWNTTRIFILESEQESFLVELKAFIESSKVFDGPLIHGQRKEDVKNILKLLPAEEGRALLTDTSHSTVFTLDLPNCSAWQQEELKLPVFIITVVKYSHEIAKWSNTGDYGHMAVIYGDQLKASALAAKLDVGLVCLNHWKIPSLLDFTPIKSSAYGNTSLSPRGSFLSNQTKINSLT